MAKSLKQQMYEQLATQHVQQALNNIGMQQLQEQYNQWNADQQGLADFQAAFNAWSEANPVQPVAQLKAQSIPVLNAPDMTDFFKPKTASGLDVNQQAAKDIDRRAFNEAYARQQQEEQMLAGRTIKPDDIIQRYAETKGISVDQAKAEYEKAESMKNQTIEKPGDVEIKTLRNADIANLLDPNRKLTDQEKKDARALAQEELRTFEYGPNKKPILNTPEERQRYADAVNLLNKTNKVSSALTGAIQQPLNLARAVRDAFTNGKKSDLARQNDESMDEAYQAAKTQNPIATTAGEIGGQIGMYALTNPLFDSLGAASGLGKVGSFALNQVGQNLQDVALDTLPTLNQYREGGLSDEERADLLKGIGINAAGNLAMGAADEGISALLRNRAARNAADEAFRANVAEGAGKLARLSEEGYIPPQKLQPDEIASLNLNPVEANNNQFSELMNTFNNQFKDESAMRNIFTPEDLDASQNAQFKTLMDENLIPERLNPVVEMEMPEDVLTPEEIRALNSEYSWTDDLPELAKAEDDVKLSDNEIKQLLSKMDTSEPPKVEAPESPKAETPKYNYDGGVDNPELTFEQNEKINSAIEYLEGPFNDDGVIKAFNDVMGEIQSDVGIKLALDYENTLEQYAKTTDPEAAKAIKDQLKEIRSTLKDIDKAEQTSISQFMDYWDTYFAIQDYKKALNGTDKEAVVTAKRAVDAARNRLARGKGKNSTLQKAFSSNYGKVAGNAVDYYGAIQTDNSDIIQEWVDYDLNKPNRFVRDAEPDRAIKSNTVEGANRLQFFADGDTPTEQWKTSKAYDTFQNQDFGKDLKKEDFAYRVQHTPEQHEIKAERYKDSKDIARDLLNKDYDTFDAADVKASFDEANKLSKQGDINKVDRLSQRLAYEGREGGRLVQAFYEYARNTFAGALSTAHKVQEDLVLNPWRSTNTKASNGNRRIAKALADMGHKPNAKNAVQLTHDQIRDGVIAELNKEVGSVEKYFNDNDIEFLTTLAEDKSIPVWQITSEIEHKLNTGDWYTLDESIPLPKPTNSKLQSALNSLVTDQVRAEKATPSLKQITEEVRNTLEKEAANFDGQFTDDDINYLANLIDNGATKEELANALDLKLATGNFGLSEETLQQVNDIFKQISNYDVNSKQFVEGQAEAFRLLANEILPDATAMEKFEAWRYLAMLGNPKTMLRNFIGNQTFGVVTGVSNNLAALAEAGIDKGIKAVGGKGIQRTKSVLNPLKDADLIKAAAEDADVSRYRQIIGSKYEKMDKNALRQSKSVFNSKLLQFYEKLTDAGISDYKAVKNKFSTSLAGYLKANGYDTNIFKAEDELKRLESLSETRLLSNAEKNTMESLKKDVSALEKARDFALKQAEYATFHEDNAVATALTKASRYLRTSDNKVLNAGGAMLEGVVPFKKTPANVLKSGLEYSPLGAIDSIKKTGKLIYENTGKRAGNLADTYLNKKGKEVAKTFASDVIDSWSKTLTGSGLTALGFYLFDKGILNSSDKDLKYQDQLEGKQNYSLTINGKTYTIDWAAPAAMPLLLGAEISKVWRDSGNDVENWYDHLDEYLNAANRIADPLIETSMLQGIKDTLETAANAAKYDENLNIPTLIGYNTLTGYATQAIPTISGQIARTVDNTRRSAYTDKEGVAGTLEKQGRKLMNKIPGLSKLNQPYVDTYGREQANSPFDNPLANLGYQMLSPGYLQDINTTDADQMARDVYSINKNENVLPKWQSYFKDAEGKRVSPEDYTTAAKAYGQANYEIRNELANDEWFKSLDDAQKEEIVKGINTISQHTGKAAIDPEYATSSKPYTAYKEGGIPSLIDYYKGEEAKATLKEMSGGNVTSGSTAGKEALSLIEEGKTEEAKAVVNAVESFQEYGKNNASYAYKRYEATKQKIPSLTVDAYKKVVDKMDGLVDNKKNGQISQKEMLAYLNKGSYSDSEAQNLWTQYGDDWKYVLGKNKEGKWIAKKKK